MNSGVEAVAINNAYISTAHALRAGEYPNVQIVKSYRPMRSRQVGIGVREGEAALLKAINESLAELKADGTTNAIFARYGIAAAVTKQ